MSLCQITGSMNVQQSSSKRLSVRMMPMGFSTSRSCTTTLRMLWAANMTLWILHNFPSNAVNVMEKPMAINQGTAMQAILHPSGDAMLSSMDRGMIVSAMMKTPKQMRYMNMG
mmetsp:Transcript_7885/g.14531  ORF Transcript_7885/g.14531 Transcript_7885/m.14531 type:complete len:113 (+) Transcript_7885:1266-1604(+)